MYAVQIPTVVYKFRRIIRPRLATGKNSVFGYYSGTNTEPNRGLLLDSSNIQIGTLKFGFYNLCFDFGRFLDARTNTN